VVASSSVTSGLLGFYVSAVGGTAFTQATTTLNLLGLATLGNDTGGQGWYDLCIAASPLNKDEVVVGGGNVWRTTTGGASWAIYGHWTGSGAPVIHADQHDLEYDAAGTLYCTNDGAVYRRSAAAWTELSNNMNISEIYRIGLSSLTANHWITGHQDNGTSIWNGTTYNAALGGDGGDCFFDRTTNSNVFAQYPGGVLRKSTNGGTSWFACTSGLSGTAPWVTVWKQDPVSANVLYCGYTNLFVSANLGTSWTQLTAIGGTGTIREFAIAPSNNQVIYVLKTSGIFKTTNGGTTWANVTGTVPISLAKPDGIAIDPKDENSAWVITGGYSAGNKVFYTTNGGASWTNISGNLPNLPPNSILYKKNTRDLLYVGMDIGVYYRDSLNTTWVLENNSLPNAPISELEISPATPDKLYASTYGRGVWALDIPVPVSGFTVAGGVHCTGDTISLNGTGANAPTSWQWIITPTTGVGMSNTGSQNPSFTFQQSGTYTLSLQAGNMFGPGSTITQTLNITAAPVVALSSSLIHSCKGAPVTLTATGANTYSWSHNGGGAAAANFLPDSTTVYTVTGTANGCSASAQATVSIQSFSIQVAGSSSLCPGNAGTLQASGAVSYSWNALAGGSAFAVTPSATAVYTVTGSSALGCTAAATATLFVYQQPDISIVLQDSVICTEETTSMTAGGGVSYTWTPSGGNSAVNIVTPSVTTVYTLSGADANGCTASSTVALVVDLCEGLPENILVNGRRYTMFPNPVKSYLEIVTPDTPQSCDISVFDASGRLLQTVRLHFHDTRAQLNLQQFAPGMYLIRLSEGDERSLPVRIIKE
jgi:hypothetical protein